MSDNTQLTNEAANLLGDLRAMLEKGGQFVIEQAPPLAKEIIAFGRAFETAELVIVIGALAWVAHFWIKQAPAMVSYMATEKKGMYDELPRGGVWRVFALVAHGIAAPIMLCWTVSQFRDFMLAWFAPRLYILEYVMSSLRGGCK